MSRCPIRKQAQWGGTLLGLALGLLVGVLISFAVVWYLNRTPLPFVERVTRPEARDESAADKTPVALPGKPGDKPGGRKFDFYDILEGKPAAPSARPDVPTGSPDSLPLPAPPTAVADGGSLYLQVGAFQKVADAETLRGRLAMLGFQATILEVDVPDKGVLHRVRVGPYAQPEEMNRVRDQLSQNGIPAAVVRIKQ
jgi:cell division protein FtsN